MREEDIVDGVWAPGEHSKSDHSEDKLIWPHLRDLLFDLVQCSAESITLSDAPAKECLGQVVHAENTENV